MGRTQRQRKRNKKDKKNSSIAPLACQINELYKFLNSYGWKNETQLVIRNFKDSGRGLTSKIGIQKEILINIPFESMISLYNLENDKEFLEVLSKLDILIRKGIQYQSLLAFYIVFKKHQKKCLLQSYLNTLPSHFANPYFCNKQELLFLPNNVLKTIINQNDIIRYQFEIFTENSSEILCPCCENMKCSEIFSIELFKWAYFVVNSRCVFIEPNQISKILKDSKIKKCLKDEPSFALAPFLDLLNHSDAVTSKAELLDSANIKQVTYNVKSDIEFKKYEQCFISYGQLTNFKLLLDYGFFIPFNKNDYFTFDLEDIEHLIRTEKIFKGQTFHKNKFKFIRDHNLDDSMFIQLDDGLSHNLVMVLYLIFKENSHFPNILSQVTFGNYISEDDVRSESELLILSKIYEYERYVNGLKNFENLTKSGQICIDYLKFCIDFLKKYLDK